MGLSNLAPELLLMVAVNLDCNSHKSLRQSCKGIASTTRKDFAKRWGRVRKYKVSAWPQRSRRYVDGVLEFLKDSAFGPVARVLEIELPRNYLHESPRAQITYIELQEVVQLFAGMDEIAIACRPMIVIL